MTTYAIEMRDRSDVWTDSLGMGREEFATIEDAREAIQSLHTLDDATYHREARIVTYDGSEEIDVVPFATTYHAIRVDMEDNAESFWDTLREEMPAVAKSLERNGCAVVSDETYRKLASLYAFRGEPSPLIDGGTEGDTWSDVVACRHDVLL